MTRTGKLARWLSLRYATVAVRSLDAEDPDPETRDRRLSHLCADVTSLQREAHEAQRIALERERIQIQVSNAEWQRKKDLHQAETRALNTQSLHDTLRTPSPLAPSHNPPIHQSTNPSIHQSTNPLATGPSRISPIITKYEQLSPLGPSPTPCTPHPSLAPYADQLDHWHKTEVQFLWKFQALLRSRILPALSVPCVPSVPSATQDPPLPTPPTLLTPSLPSFASVQSRVPALLPLLTLLTLLPLVTLQPLPACQKPLLKQAQLLLQAFRPAESRASPPQDDPQDHSQAIALMRKEYFADVDEYERSGLLKIPPL